MRPTRSFLETSWKEAKTSKTWQPYKGLSSLLTGFFRPTLQPEIVSGQKKKKKMDDPSMEPWATLILLTLFLLYVMLAGSVSVISFLPEKSAETEALRRVSLVVAVLLMYDYGLRLWSMLPPDRMWMAWIFFATVTVGAIGLVVLSWKLSLRNPQKKTSTGGSRDLQAPLLNTSDVPTQSAS